MRAVVGIAVALDFLAAMAAGKIFNCSGEFRHKASTKYERYENTKLSGVHVSYLVSFSMV